MTGNVRRRPVRKAPALALEVPGILRSTALIIDLDTDEVLSQQLNPHASQGASPILRVTPGFYEPALYLFHLLDTWTSTTIDTDEDQRARWTELAAIDQWSQLGKTAGGGPSIPRRTPHQRHLGDQPDGFAEYPPTRPGLARPAGREQVLLHADLWPQGITCSRARTSAS